MADTPFTTFAFPATGRSVSATMPNRLARVINVVDDFGADNTGNTDCTVAVQAAFDAAFGSYTSPHGKVATLNRPVHFPAGSYTLTSRGSATITNVVAAAGNICRLTLSASITGTFNESDQVMIADVNGVPNVNGLYNIHIVDSTHVEVYPQFSGAFTSSPTATMKLPCLKVRALESGMITGDGCQVSGIGTSDSKCAVIATNGCARSVFKNLGIFSGVNGTCFDLSWMLSDPMGNDAVSCQTNHFEKMWFGCPVPGSKAKYGLAIGGAGNMGSENTILNCTINECDAGLITLNGNALQQSYIGGNNSQNNTGVYALSGSIPLIEGVGFQQNLVTDINIAYEAGDTYEIIGCRDEDGHAFLTTGPVVPVNVSGCSYKSTGFLHTGNGRVTFTSCHSGVPALTGGGFEVGGEIVIIGSHFVDPAYMDGALAVAQLTTIPRPIRTQTGATYTFIGPDCGSKVSFNRATAQTVTVPRTHGNGTFLTEGAKIEVEQLGAGQVTFQAGSSVTVRSAHGLKLAAQWSTATLTVIAPDVWLLSGDTTV